MAQQPRNVYNVVIVIVTEKRRYSLSIIAKHIKENRNLMTIRITDMVLRIFGVLALLLGILLWTGVVGDGLKPIHMLLGIIVTISLLILGIAFGTMKGGNWGLGGVAILWAIIVAAFGLFQEQMVIGNAHWVIQVLHLIFGLVAIGLGEMINARSRRITTAQTRTAA